MTKTRGKSNNNKRHNKLSNTKTKIKNIDNDSIEESKYGKQNNNEISSSSIDDTLIQSHMQESCGDQEFDMHEGEAEMNIESDLMTPEQTKIRYKRPEYQSSVNKEGNFQTYSCNEDPILTDLGNKYETKLSTLFQPNEGLIFLDNLINEFKGL